MSRMEQRPRAVDGPATNGTADHIEEAVVAEVRKALKSIEYGSVLIKIHQGEVVGIETSTKVRLKST